MMFFNFKNFFAFIFEFSNLGWVQTDRKEIFFVLYFSACPDPFRLEMKPRWCFLIFKIFIAFIFKFSNSGRVRTERKEIFFLFYYLACLHPFRIDMKPGWCVLIFIIFLHLFLNFLTQVGFERIGRKLFLFSIFRPFLDRFVLKWSMDDVF